jgi:hypothetical protein
MSMIPAVECGCDRALESAEPAGRRGGFGQRILSLAALCAAAAASGAFSAPPPERDVTRAHVARIIEREIIAERLAPQLAPAPAPVVLAAPNLGRAVEPETPQPGGSENAAELYGETMWPWLAAVPDGQGAR